jgi:hypothetical protein
MSYETQGRQQHGWFGHGTAPKTASAEQSATAAAYAVVAVLPANKRRAYSDMLNRGGLDRLRTLVPLWAAANDDANNFAQTYFAGN